MDMREVKKDGKVIYDGKIFKIELDTVICPNKREAKREIVRHHGGACILAVNDKEEILLIKQFRYAYDEVIYEIPAGKLEENEEPYAAALRELEEETGYKANKLDYLGVIYPTVGYCSEKIYIYQASEFIKTQTNFDEDEVIEAEFVPLKKVLEMIQNGIIKDAKVICAINYYLINKGI